MTLKTLKNDLNIFSNTRFKKYIFLNILFYFILTFYINLSKLTIYLKYDIKMTTNILKIWNKKMTNICFINLSKLTNYSKIKIIALYN
jgi:hypothetical protein